MTYSYYISFNAGGAWTEVIPTQRLKLKCKRELGPDSRMAYRERIGNDLIIHQRLNASVWASLLSWWNDDTKYDTKILIKIYRGTSAGTLIHSAYFSVIDGEIDKEIGSYIVQPTPDDAYSQFDEKNAIQLRPISHPGGDDIYKFALPSLNFVNAAGPNDWDTLNWTLPTLGLIKTTLAHVPYGRCNIGTSIEGEVVTIIIDAFLGTGNNPTVNIVNASFVSITSGDVPVTAAGTYTFILTAATATAYIQFSAATNDTLNRTFTVSATKWLWYSNGAETLKAYIAVIFNSGNMDTGYAAGDIKSTFLFNDALPATGKPATIDALITAHPTYNYVTGAVNKLNYLLLMTRSTGVVKFTFTEFMAALNSLLNIYWYIDNDGNFRIEHEYWFEDLRTTGIDITGAGYLKYKPEYKKLKFLKESLYGREHWEITDNNGTDFIGKDIIYGIYGTTINIKEYRNALIATDWPYFIAGSGLNDGLILIQTAYAGVNNDYVEVFESTPTDGSQSNGNMAMTNLHDNYWTYGRYAITGTMNGSPATFDSAVPMKKQSVKFPSLTDIDYFGITTLEGSGIIDEDEHDLDTDFHNIDILYTVY